MHLEDTSDCLSGIDKFMEYSVAIDAYIHRECTSNCLSGIDKFVENSVAIDVHMHREGTSNWLSAANDDNKHVAGGVSSSHPDSVFFCLLSSSLPAVPCRVPSGLVFSCLRTDTGCVHALSELPFNRMP
ncbi:hypothetical protein J6590_007929 [Homalodisca vitripennis]|nr:hypothetical protein J6590_007929 [Homalodisca vitripennis]